VAGLKRSCQEKLNKNNVIRERYVMTAEPQVTARDTKAVILQEYERALDRINELESQRFDPAQVKAKEAKAKAIAKAVNPEQTDLDTQFVRIHRGVDDSLRYLKATLEERRAEVDQLNAAKTALAEELEQLYGIQAQAQSFAALVEAQKERQAAFDEAIQEAREQRALETKEHALALETEGKEFEASQKRAKEEWEYDFNRHKREMNDKAKDEIEQMQKDWRNRVELEEKSLATRVEEIEKREKELEDLRTWFAEAPAKLDAAEAKGQKKAAQSAAIEISALERNHEADTRILTHEVDGLKTVNTQLAAQVVALEDKLEAAYEKIQTVASKALDSQGNVLAMSEVQRAVAAASSSKKS
jgi:hypothetical protein